MSKWCWLHMVLTWSKPFNSLKTQMAHRTIGEPTRGVAQLIKEGVAHRLQRRGALRGTVHQQLADLQARQEWQAALPSVFFARTTALCKWRQ